MLNFLGALSSLLPGYVQGRRQAIQDNWQDLNNYNNVQAGQLSNAFTEDTFWPRVSMMYNGLRRDNMNTIYSGLNLAEQIAGFPNRYYRGLIGSMFGPAQAYQDNWMQLLAGNKALGMAGENPMALFQNRPQGMNPAPTVAQQQQLGG